MSKQIVAVLFEPIINEMKNFRFPRRSTRNEPKSKPSFPTREEVSSRRTLTQRHYYASLMMRPDTCNKIIMPVQQEMLRRLIDSKKSVFVFLHLKAVLVFYLQGQFAIPQNIFLNRAKETNRLMATSFIK
jgi:hypothetical protein